MTEYLVKQGVDCLIAIHGTEKKQLDDIQLTLELNASIEKKGFQTLLKKAELKHLERLAQAMISIPQSELPKTIKVK